MQKILVIGSYNVGLTVLGSRIPRPGETVLGDRFDMGPGGKGSNQAITIARLGGDVTFLAKLGRDIFADDALRLFEHEGLDAKHLLFDPEAHTGAGIIFVNAEGQNAIGVAPGANYRLSTADLDAAEALFTQSRYLLMQLETPLPVVYHAIEKARAAGATVILNPAPAQPIEPRYLAKIDILTPNETEAEILTGVAVNDLPTAFEAARRLRDQGVKQTIVTLGEKGSVLVDATREAHFPAPKVRSVDTTGAGDAFNGGLVYALAAGRTIDEAIGFASRVGAYSVMSVGVVPGLPRQADLERFEREGGHVGAHVDAS
ncbi:MAG: Ribokinase [candidate division BRC1 bacterium ADurb.BinA292]|nr:MAG: Ribokinase [candidate division BRC1 bacterium ADurb.BinA292]